MKRGKRGGRTLATRVHAEGKEKKKGGSIEPATEEPQERGKRGELYHLRRRKGEGG